MVRDGRSTKLVWFLFSTRHHTVGMVLYSTHNIYDHENYRESFAD